MTKLGIDRWDVHLPKISILLDNGAAFPMTNPKIGSIYP